MVIKQELLSNTHIIGWEQQEKTEEKLEDAEPDKESDDSNGVEKGEDSTSGKEGDFTF